MQTFLESAARANGAAETTLTAIQGARVLLGMAELPPEPAEPDDAAPET